jgi:RNA polymerase sigma-70 factor (ECF subfamily)
MTLPSLTTPQPAVSPEEAELVDALRHGDEAAFRQLVAWYQTSLIRLARAYVRSRAVAEEVVQDTWLAALRAIHRFEGRAPLKSWLCGILVRRARTTATREARHDRAQPAAAPERFRGLEDPWPGHWAAAPRPWGESPERLVLRAELRQILERAIRALPQRQRVVITLRDVEGMSAEDACNILGLSETNQRVLLHRARTRVRAAVEAYLDEGGGT